MTRRRVFVVLAVVVVLGIVGVVAGPWIYEKTVVGDQPAPLSLPVTGGADLAADGLNGPWQVAQGSAAGYRVNEVLFGRAVTVVGRTSQVQGGLTVDGTTVSGITVTVDMASVQTDESMRDVQYRDRIMSTATYPTATFVQTEDVALPAATGQFVVQITGDLTVRGQTRSVTVDLDVQVSSTVAVQGAIDVVFADYGIPEPGFGGISVDDHGVIEFLLLLTRPDTPTAVTTATPDVDGPVTSDEPGPAPDADHPAPPADAPVPAADNPAPATGAPSAGAARDGDPDEEPARHRRHHDSDGRHWRQDDDSSRHWRQDDDSDGASWRCGR